MYVKSIKRNMRESIGCLEVEPDQKNNSYENYAKNDTLFETSQRTELAEPTTSTTMD